MKEKTRMHFGQKREIIYLYHTPIYQRANKKLIEVGADSRSSRIFKHGLAETFALSGVVVSLARAGGSVTQRLYLRCQTHDAKLCLLKVLVQPLYLTRHATLQLKQTSH